jgi:membrane-bound serine protease (ClpP class)
MKKKVTSDAAAYLRSFVSKRGRPVETAELAVTEAKSFTDQEALDGKLIDLVAESREALLKELDMREIKRFDGSAQTLALAAARIEPWEMTQRQRFLARILDPNVAFLLLVFGILGLYIEFNHPGVIFPGVVGGICLILAMFALNLLPVNYAAVLLIVLAFALFILEAKFTSHGILGAGGVAAMVIGALMLVESPPIPELRVRLGTALSVALPLAIITVILLRAVWKSRAWGAAVGREALVGAVGEVRETLEPGAKGLVLIGGELWRAVSEQRIEAGQAVRVVGVEGLLLRVEPDANRGSVAARVEKEAH